MKRVLVVEDERNIREFVVINLERAGYETVEAATGDEALDLYDKSNGKFDVVVLDIMMPGEHDGLSVCREIRQRNSSVGIIMLSARTQEMDKVSGLMMGADDYMTKPFSPSELVARVDAIYRRVTRTSPTEDGPEESLASGEFRMKLKSHSLYRGDEFVELTHVEFQIMTYFLSHPGETVTRGDLLRYVWGSDYDGDEKIVDVNIRRLRVKVEENPSNPVHIVTVWGLGYRWDA